MAQLPRARLPPPGLYINTLSVLFADQLVGARGGAVRFTSVVLLCSGQTTAERRSRREVGSALAEHVRRSQQAALHLEASVPADAVRVGQTTKRCRYCQPVGRTYGWAAP